MSEIKVGDTIIITDKKFWHTFPIGTVCKVEQVFSKENPFEYHQDGISLSPDYNVTIKAVSPVYGGYELYEGEYEKVFAFDAEIEVNALKARIEALETALQRVPYAGYDKAESLPVITSIITIKQVRPEQWEYKTQIYFTNALHFDTGQKVVYKNRVYEVTHSDNHVYIAVSDGMMRKEDV